MKKLFAILFTILSILSIKETIYVFSTTDVDVVRTRSVMIVVWISITLPLIIFTLWLWRPGPPKA